jgi:hypothetical protein
MPPETTTERWGRVIKRLWMLYSMPKLLAPLAAVWAALRVVATPIADIIARTTLPRSVTTPAEATVDYRGCNHSVLIKRANGTARWWTCSACGTRWPRLPNEEHYTNEPSLPEAHLRLS